MCLGNEVVFLFDIIIQGNSEEKSSQQNHVRKWLSNVTHCALVEFPPLALQFIWQTLQKMYKQTCITLTPTLKQVDVHIIRQKRRPPEWRDTRTVTDSDSGLGGISTPCSGAGFKMTDRLCYIIWRVSWKATTATSKRSSSFYFFPSNLFFPVLPRPLWPSFGP